MSFPAFFGALTPIFDLRAESASGDEEAERDEEQLGFCLDLQMPRREQSEWCWAATTAGVASFLNPNAGWTQCKVASHCLTMPCCPATSTCNYQYTLDRALRTTGHLALPPVERALRFDEIVHEVGNSRPVGCHIQWSTNQGHFNVIVGFIRATQDVIVRDSAYEGDQVLPYEDFVDRYQRIGKWDCAYLTQKAL